MPNDSAETLGERVARLEERVKGQQAFLLSALENQVKVNEALSASVNGTLVHLASLENTFNTQVIGRRAGVRDVLSYIVSVVTLSLVALGLLARVLWQ